MDYVERNRIVRGLSVLITLIENDDIGVAVGYMEGLYERLLKDQYDNLDVQRQNMLHLIQGIHSK